MKVLKWGNSLAISLPAVLSEALMLHDGDDIELTVLDNRQFAIKRMSSRRDLLNRLDKFQGRLPADLRLDHREANPDGDGPTERS